MGTRPNRSLNADFKAVRADNICMVKRIAKLEAIQTASGESVVATPGDYAIYDHAYQLLSIVNEKELSRSFVKIVEDDLPI